MYSILEDSQEVSIDYAIIDKVFENLDKNSPIGVARARGSDSVLIYFQDFNISQGQLVRAVAYPRPGVEGSASVFEYYVLDTTTGALINAER